MEDHTTLFLLLPAFNEKDALAPLIRSAQEQFRRQAVKAVFVVVDDGSTDGTAEAASQAAPDADVRIVTHERNLGLGVALRTGFSTILSVAAPRDVIVTMDADGTHDPALIKDMLAALDRGYDVVIASRFAPGGTVSGVPPARRALSRVAAFVGRLLSGIEGVRDYSSGYRAYRASALKNVWDRAGGNLPSTSSFAATAELLLKLGAAGAKVTEVPLQLRYDLKTTPSKMKLLRTCFSYLAIYLRNARLSR